MIKILITGGNGNIAKMIKNNLSNKFNITNLSRYDLNILNQFDIEKYLENNDFDILVHTAINGGRRTKEEDANVVYNNLLMFENLLKFSHKFKLIINFDSAAIYDRNTDIYDRKETDIFTIPTDYYGFSKYLIHNRSLQYNNVYNFRIFNIFHVNEELDRFVKSCFNAKKNNTVINIYEDKYFDFVYEDDFMLIIEYYFNNIYNQHKLIKTINICYEKKYKLSDIAFLILNDITKINIINDVNNKNYCGNNSLLKSLNLDLFELENSLKIYSDKFN